MSPQRRYPPDRVPRRYAERPRSAASVRASQRTRYSRGPVQSTKALTTKLVILAVVGSLLIGGLIAAQMASGNDPALGPKAVARANKKASTKQTSKSSTASSNGSGSSDPYSQSYNSDPYAYGGSSGNSGSGGYSSGSSGYSSGSSGYSSGSSGSTYSAPPVTSSTS
jgi:hypothetical protein